MRATIRQSTQRHAADEQRRGVAATELALILPLFLLLVLGAVDFGRFASRVIAVANGSRAGAGFAVMNPYTTTTQSVWATKMKQAVVDEMQSMFDSRFGDSNLTVTSLKTNETGSYWRIKVTVVFPFQTILNWPGIPHTVNVTQSTEMRGIR